MEERGAEDYLPAQSSIREEGMKHGINKKIGQSNDTDTLNEFVLDESGEFHKDDEEENLQSSYLSNQEEEPDYLVREVKKNVWNADSKHPETISSAELKSPDNVGYDDDFESSLEESLEEEEEVKDSDANQSSYMHQKEQVFQRIRQTDTVSKDYKDNDDLYSEDMESFEDEAVRPFTGDQSSVASEDIDELDFSTGGPGSDDDFN